MNVFRPERQTLDDAITKTRTLPEADVAGTPARNFRPYAAV
jgi:hypothetical protein